MSLRSFALGLALATAAAAAAAQTGTQPDPNAPPLPYGVRPPAKAYVPPPTPLPVAPMDQPPDRARTFGAMNYDPPGYGWCRFTDDLGKHTYYSAPFPGSPKHDLSPRDAAFADFIQRTYPGSRGQVDCYWMPYDSAYASQSTEERNESADQLRNYNMTNTLWKPPG